MPYRSFQVKNKFSCDSNAVFFFSYLTFDIIFIRNLWMFFQGWRNWRRNILKFFCKGHVFNNDCCFCILVPQCLKIDDSYKCGVGLEHRKFSIMLSTIMKNKRNVRAKELQNRLCRNQCWVRKLCTAQAAEWHFSQGQKASRALRAVAIRGSILQLEISCQIPVQMQGFWQNFPIVVFCSTHWALMELSPFRYSSVLTSLNNQKWVGGSQLPPPSRYGDIIKASTAISTGIPDTLLAS